MVLATSSQAIFGIPEKTTESLGHLGWTNGCGMGTAVPVANASRGTVCPAKVVDLCLTSKNVSSDDRPPSRSVVSV
jgi:hypothetical protein